VLEEVLLPPGCDIVCYADDTLILAAGRDWGGARSRANEATASVAQWGKRGKKSVFGKRMRIFVIQ